MLYNSVSMYHHKECRHKNCQPYLSDLCGSYRIARTDSPRQTCTFSTSSSTNRVDFLDIGVLRVCSCSAADAINHCFPWNAPFPVESYHWQFTAWSSASVDRAFTSIFPCSIDSISITNRNLISCNSKTLFQLYIYKINTTVPHKAIRIHIPLP
jgi:hypothetical protein